MSPVSRGRKGRKPHGPPRRKIAHKRPRTIEDDFALLNSLRDPFDVEGFGASYLIASSLADPEFVHDGVAEAVTAEFEQRASPDALALLLSMGVVARGGVRELIMAAADRMVAAGVAEPPWAAELRAPLAAGECLRMADDADLRSWLGCTFQRAGRTHGLLVAVDEWLDGVARKVTFIDRDDMRAVFENARTQSGGGFAYTIESVSVDDFAGAVERVLDARDNRDVEIHPRRETDDEFLVAAVMARARADAMRR